MLALNDNMSIKGINSLEAIHTQYLEFFVSRTYEWWYQVQPDDIVMDVGTCIGMFTCHALDRGAKKVYAIEPNKQLLQTTLDNATPHILNKKESPVVPINCAIGKDKRFSDNTFGNCDKSNIEIRSFKNIIDYYGITHIDYLKIDAEGAEYDILSEENLDFIKNNVKHISVEVHLDAFREAPEMFLNFRDKVLSQFDRDKIKFMSIEDERKTYDNEYITSNWPIGWGGCWMIYICNKSLP